MVSQWRKKGMPCDSVESANAWRETNAPPRGRKKPSASPDIESSAIEAPADLIPPREERHQINRIDDQGEAEGDQSNNPYDALRQAKLAEQEANRQRQRVADADGDPIEYAKAQASFIQAQKHRMWMQKQVSQWAREQGITLYVSEAKAIYLQAFNSILRRLDLLGAKTAPLCSNPKTAKTAIEEGVNRIRAAAMEEMEGSRDAGGN
ncbi:hypothetical protein SAMN05444156_3234 [Verrucomicrobium sp. GAS474]|nr:hypothetical protein SAMN05444156_3234 [Verrucomicrobium sp. GAS474]